MFSALLDTCVLWPSFQRDFLLSLAIESLYRPLWSEQILAELEHEEATKLQDRHGLDLVQAERRAAHLVAEMRNAFGDAEVSGWEPLEGTYGLPDQNDEHVVAAAHISGAQAIITLNLRDFPPTRLPPHIEVLTPANFAHHTVELNPGLACKAINEVAQRSGRFGPKTTSEAIIKLLAERYEMTSAMELVVQYREQQ